MRARVSPRGGLCWIKPAHRFRVSRRKRDLRVGNGSYGANGDGSLAARTVRLDADLIATLTPSRIAMYSMSKRCCRCSCSRLFCRRARRERNAWRSKPHAHGARARMCRNEVLDPCCRFGHSCAHRGNTRFTECTRSRSRICTVALAASGGANMSRNASFHVHSRARLNLERIVVRGRGEPRLVASGTVTRDSSSRCALSRGAHACSQAQASRCMRPLHD